jgi:inositol transport system ATP-binding protein
MSENLIEEKAKITSYFPSNSTPIYKLINQLTDIGIAVIMISSELPEILGMSDRILVLSKGKQTALFTKQEATQEKIMQYAVE